MGRLTERRVVNKSLTSRLLRDAGNKTVLQSCVAVQAALGTGLPAKGSFMPEKSVGQSLL